MANSKIYIASGRALTTISDSGYDIFGNTGNEAVKIGTGVDNVILDANVERVVFAGATTDYTYKQVGNALEVYSSTGALVTSVTLQDETDAEIAAGAKAGTQLTFANGTVDAKIVPPTAGNPPTVTIGGQTVSATTATGVTIPATNIDVVTHPITVPTFSVASVSATAVEGTSAVFVVNLANAPTTQTTVDFTLTNVGGASDNDTGDETISGTNVTGVVSVETAPNSGIYKGSLTFAPGATSATISLPVELDSLVETGEGITLSLSNPSTGAFIGANNVTTTFVDAPAATYTIVSNVASGVSTPEGQMITFTITPSTAVTFPTQLSVNLIGAALGGIVKTTSPDDFGSMPTLSFAAGDTLAKTVTVNVLSDTVTEGIEAYKAQLLDTTNNAYLEVASTTGTIVDASAANSTTTLTLNLTAATDSLLGGAGNDTFNGDVAFNTTTSAYDIPTLGVFDTIDGGTGTDTLTITQMSNGNYTLPGATIRNVENLVIKNANGAVTADVQAIAGLTSVDITNGTANNVTVDTKSNVTSVALTKAATTTTITDNGNAATTADKLATVSLTGNTSNVNISSDALTTLSLKDTAFGATVTAAAGTRALTVNMDSVTGGTVTDAEATSLSIKASGAKTSGISFATAKATAVTIDSTVLPADNTVGATITDLSIAAAKTITATGTGAITIAGTSNVTALTSVDASANKGGLKITPQLGTGVAFTGGEGKDSVSLNTGHTKAVSMGLGDDTVIMTGAPVTGIVISGGDGTDTLQMAAADAATVSAGTTFKAQIASFEKVSLGSVAALTTDNINLSNLNDISYVVSAGTTAGAGGTTETASVIFFGLTSGQSATIGGLTVTATGGSLTAAEVAEALDGDTAGYAGSALTPNAKAVLTGALTGFTATPITAGSTVVYTSTATGTSVPDMTASKTDTNATAAVAPSVVTTQGVAAVTETATVAFSSLVSGETTVVNDGAGRTITVTAPAASNESVALNLTGAINVNNQSVVISINGTTYTKASNSYAALPTIVINDAVNTDGTAKAGWNLGGVAPTYGYSAGNLVALTTGNKTNLVDADITFNVNGGGATPINGFVGTITNGSDASSLTAASVATQVQAGAGTNVTTNGVFAGWNRVASTNTVTFTATTPGNVADLTIQNSGAVTSYTQGVAATFESSVLTFNSLLAGQSVTVAGLTLTASADLTAIQVADAFNNIAAGTAAATIGAAGVVANVGTFTGTLTGFASDNSLGNATATFTSSVAGNVTDITTSVTQSTATVPAVTTTQQGGVGATAGGILNITNMGAAGTLELTSAINGASSVTLANSTGTADVLNIKLNGAANLVNTAALSVANVETINITATDSTVDTTTLTNPAAASTILLNAPAATAITVAGNHGVNFTGSTLTNVVSLDASGVVSVGPAANATAAQIATTGAVTFTSVVNNKAVTVTTGNGADNISVASINDATFLATGATAATITTGDGADTITGSAGKDIINAGAGNDVVTGGLRADTITLGAGNDRYVLTSAAESTLANLDVITDFSPNTYGNGTSGAAGTGAAIASVASFTGDVIDLRAFIAGAINKVSVAVVASESAATISVQNVGDATTDTIAIALDSSTGRLYMDMNSDGVSDSVMQLTGVTTITNAAFLIA